MVRSHRDLILNWFRARGQFSSGVVEGFNGKARVITKRAYGFRTSGALEVALYHALGDLPEPEFTPTDSADEAFSKVSVSKPYSGNPCTPRCTTTSWRNGKPESGASFRCDR